MGKQANRNAQKKAAKADDEPAVASTSGGFVVAATQLVLNSVLVDLLPGLPKLIQAESSTAETTNGSDEKKEQDEPSNDTAKEASKPVEPTSIFEGLIVRLPFYNTLGLDTAPEEAWLMFKGLDMDGGPYRRKKGNAKMERIMLNVERNMSQYLHLTLLFMCLHALTFRSTFACLPWLVGYQLLSLNFPMDSIRESFPQVPVVDFKYRLAVTMGIHVFVWLFFLIEVIYQINFLWKILLVIVICVHAYVVVPDVNPEKTRATIAENLKKAADSTEAAPVASTAGAKDTIAVAKQVVMGSVLMKQGPTLPNLLKGMKAEMGTTETKKDEGEEKPLTEASGDGEKLFESLDQDLSIFNILGLGLPASREAAKESWIMLKGLQMDFGPKVKSGSATQDRIIQNLTKNMPQYLHLLLAMMCLRSFFFRSFFACLPWLVGYQLLCLHLPAGLIASKVPQVTQNMEFKIRVVATLALHAFMLLFFAYEVVLKTGLFEKILLAGLFVAHSYIVSPVVN